MFSDIETPTGMTEETVSRIRKEILALLSCHQLLGRIRLPPISRYDKFQLQFNHSSEKKELIIIQFPIDYPESPPKIILQAPQNLDCFKSNLLSQLLRLDIWDSQTFLSCVILDIYKTIDNFYEEKRRSLQKDNQSANKIVQKLRINKDKESVESMDESFNSNQNKKSKLNSKRKKKHVTMNGCSDRELTETKNLNRHFRSKLREILKDMESRIDDEISFRQVSQMFVPNRVGFDDIKHALKNEWFSKQVKRQIESGRFLHKILKGMMGMKSKKLMIKYYHVMLSAVYQPDTFVRWKYDKS